MTRQLYARICISIKIQIFITNSDNSSCYRFNSRSYTLNHRSNIFELKNSLSNINILPCCAYHKHNFVCNKVDHHCVVSLMDGRIIIVNLLRNNTRFSNIYKCEKFTLIQCALKPIVLLNIYPFIKDKHCN